ncbi:MAG: type II toxin-antitoxin system VapC family toxin [Alphaproteobacteria bacterium]
MSLIIDASVAVKWFVREDGHGDALELLDRAEDLHAPDLILSEAANTAWKKCRRGELARDQAEAIATALPHYFSRIWPSRGLIARALDLALALDHPVYDGLYLACAEAADGTLISADRRLIDLAGKAGLGGRVHPLGAPLP